MKIFKPLAENKEYWFNTCKIGQGAECCKYLVYGAKGFECMRDDPENKKVVDDNWAIHEHVAQGDNCKGYNIELKLNDVINTPEKAKNFMRRLKDLDNEK